MSKTVVAVSGCFDPITNGLLEYLRGAKKLGDKLIVILKGDATVIRLYGSCIFTAEERKKIIQETELADCVHIYESDHDHLIGALDLFRPQIYACGGPNRVPGNVREEDFCFEKNIKIIYGVGGYDYNPDISADIEKILEKIDVNWRDRP